MLFLYLEYYKNNFYYIIIQSIVFDVKESTYVRPTLNAPLFKDHEYMSWLQEQYKETGINGVGAKPGRLMWYRMLYFAEMMIAASDEYEMQRVSNWMLSNSPDDVLIQPKRKLPIKFYGTIKSPDGMTKLMPISPSNVMEAFSRRNSIPHGPAKAPNGMIQLPVPPPIVSGIFRPSQVVKSDEIIQATKRFEETIKFLQARKKASDK